MQFICFQVIQATPYQLFRIPLDVAGFFTSIVAVLVARRQASHQYSFGFQRAQSIGAFASMALVWMLTIYLIIEAIERIRNPEEIDGKIMFFVALLGLAVNIVY